MATNELQIKVISLPANADTLRQVRKTGDTVSMHYTGTLYPSGRQFDSSSGREPLVTKIGAGQVIEGWDEGIPGMVVGEKRELIIPSRKAYGAKGIRDLIPPNATLKFEVELVSITNA